LVIFGVQETPAGSRETKLAATLGLRIPVQKSHNSEKPITVAQKGNTCELCEITSFNHDWAPVYADKEFS
jgi:hypothetical protein